MNLGKTNATAREPAHETTDVSIKWIAVVLSAFVVSAVVLHFALAGLQVGFKKQTERLDRRLPGRIAEPAISTAITRFPDPTLQTSSRDDLQAFRACEEAQLNEYGWIDKTAGVVRIPIDRAIDILSERGLPVRGTNVAPRQISELELIRNRANKGLP